MSWGYVPKKLKRKRRERLLRKKYQNFSCDTCRFEDVCCSIAKHGNGRVEFCSGWDKIQKVNNACTSSGKKEKKGFLKKLFK